MKRSILVLTLLAMMLALITCSREPAEQYVLMKTDFGDVVIDLYEEQTPLHAANFKELALNKSFNDIYFHRIIPGFVVQGGDPNTLNNNRADDGTGGIGERIPAEIGQPHLRGALGAARDNNPEKKSSGSQFYFCLERLKQLDGNYTVFGMVVDGMNVVDSMALQPRDPRDNPLKPIRILDTELVDAKEYK